MGDVVDLLEYWRDEPPAHMILAARYLERKPGKRRVTEQEMERQMMELQTVMHAPASPLPEGLREMANWASEQEARLKGKR